MKTRIAVLAALLMAGHPLAQDSVPREFAIGLVRGIPKGKTATVELLGQPWAAQPVLGDVDPVRVETDAHGRFRAGLLPGRAYAAWAFVERDDGSVLSSPIEGGLVARGTVALELDVEHPQVLRTLRVEGGGDAEIRVELRAPAQANRPSGEVAPSFGFLLEAAGEGRFRVPPLPAGGVRCRVRSPAGLFLTADRSLKCDVDDPSVKIDSEAIKPRRLAVRDIDTGKGVPGATIYARLQSEDSPLVPVATTDALGCAEIRAIESLRYIACDPDHAPAALQPAEHAGGEAGWLPLAEDYKPDFVAHVGSGIALRGRLRVGDRPAPDSIVLLSEGAMHYQQKNSRSLEWMQRVLELDAEGGFEQRGVLAEFPPDVVVLMGRKTIAALPPSWRDVWPVVTSAVAVDSNAHANIDFGDIDLAALVPIRIQVESADGAPGLDAQVQLLPRCSTFGRTRLPSTPVDRSGGCTILLPKETVFGLLVETGDALIAGSLSIGTRKDNEPFKVTLRTRPKVALEGRVVDSEHKPIDGAFLHAQVTMPRSVVRFGKEGKGTAQELPAVFDTTLDPTQSSEMFNDRLRPSCRSDASGHFVLMLPDVGLDWTIQSNRVQVKVSADDWPPKPIEIELPSK